MKCVFVTGGVVSGLGKRITTASFGRLLKCRRYKVASQKLDPYINYDPGTMRPIQHGGVFVTKDGIETDLDLGHYERITDGNLTKSAIHGDFILRRLEFVIHTARKYQEFFVTISSRRRFYEKLHIKPIM